MGDSINTAVSEYFPTISLDGKHLVFTRRVNGINEDFYESDRMENGWTRPGLLPEISTAITMKEH